MNGYRWKDGLIYIEDKSFDAIMQLFEKFYDVRIVINNQEVKDQGYRGKLRISDGVATLCVCYKTIFLLFTNVMKSETSYILTDKTNMPMGKDT